MNKGLEQEKVTKEYHVPPTKAQLAFMKQQEKLVKYFSFLNLLLSYEKTK